MSTPNYSAAAIAIRSRFTKTMLHCYVEASEDKIFWKAVISKANPLFNIRFYEVGDCKRVEKIIEKIIQGDKRKMAIRDSDYLEVLNLKIEHPRVIYTFGYSMENSLYNPHNISKAIDHLSSTGGGRVNTTDQWLRKCFTQLKELIILDIADLVLGKGIGVLGDKGNSYLDNEKDFLLSEQKINRRIAEVEAKFTPEELIEYRELVEKFRKRKYLIIRGHLMSHLVLNFINREIDRCKPVGKKGKLNHGSIYEQLVGQIDIKTIDPAEMSYIINKIKKINQELNLKDR